MTPLDERDEAGSAPYVAVAPGGRAVVAWQAQRRPLLGVVAASGQAGGAWAPATRLSSVTRDAYAISVALDAAGAPRVWWNEPGLGVRGAALAAARADTTAPVVSASLPARLAPTRSGRVRAAVRVRCSEACDARLRLVHAGREGASAVRALAAGRGRTLRIRASAWLAEQLRLHPGQRTQRLELVVTDRAGNVTRLARRLRIRVIG